MKKNLIISKLNWDTYAKMGRQCENGTKRQNVERIIIVALDFLLVRPLSQHLTGVRRGNHIRGGRLSFEDIWGPFSFQIERAIEDIFLDVIASRFQKILQALHFNT